ncbi:MAG: hypothetical protein ABIO70_24355 [Pseudomonadota bacterium]
MTRLFLLLPLALSACVDENDVCTTYDGTLCTDLQATVEAQAETIAAQQAAIADLTARLDALEAVDCLTGDDLTGYATETWVEEGFADAATVAGLETDIADHEGRIGSLESDVADHEGRIAGLETDAGDQEARIAAIEADYLVDADIMGLATEAWVTGGFGTLATAADHEARIAAIEDDYLVSDDVADAVRLITADTTYPIASEADLIAAIADLDGLRIAHDATVTLDVAGGNYNLSAPLLFSHPDGDRIELHGAGVGLTTLVFASGDGIVVEGASALGFVGDMDLVGSSTGNGVTAQEASATTLGDLDFEGWNAGVLAHENGAISLEDGAALSFTGCGYGAYVDGSGYADVTGAVASASTGAGFVVYGGYLNAYGATSTGAAGSGFRAYANGYALLTETSSDANGGGYYAHSGAYISAGYATATSNANNGFSADYGGTIYAAHSEATGNAETGYLADQASTIFGVHASAETNGDHGFYATNHSVIDAPYSYASGNGIYQYVTYYNGFIYARPTASGSDTTDVYYAGHDFSDLMIF